MTAPEAGLPVASPVALRRWVRRAVGDHRRASAGVVVAQASATVATLAFPYELGRVVAAVTGRHGAATVRSAGEVLVVALVVQALASRAASRRASVLGETVLAGLREDFVDRVLDLPLGLVESAGTGELLGRASSDVEQMSYSLRYAIPQLMVALVQGALTAAALVVTAPFLSLVLVPSLAVLTVASRSYLGRAGEGYRRTQATWDRFNARMQETVAAGRTVETFGLGERRVELNEADIGAWLATERYTLGLRTRFFPVCEAAYLLPLVLGVGVGGLLAIDGHLSLAALTAAGLYAAQLVVPLEVVVRQLDQVQMGAASLARILGVAEVERIAPTPDEPDTEEVVADGVRFAYRPGAEVLRGLDLAPVPGSTVALVGPSGAGKSTLALLLAGIHAPTGGRVTVGGVDTWRMPSARLRRHVVLVTQEHHVFSGTLRDNLELACPGAGDGRLLDALLAVDAEALVARLPDGLDTRLGRGAAVLSPVEAQRVALARLVLADPHTLVLDEATALLDPLGARHLERSLRAVLTGRTVVAVAHRLQSAVDADLVVVVEEGRVVESGTHDELVVGSGSYAALWEAWRSGG